jgi:GEVED domain/Secretion system C-terminal sorting domain
MMKNCPLTQFSTLFGLTLLLCPNLVAQPYCASKGNRPWQEWIANVQFNGINNSSSKEGYGNFSNQVAILNRDSMYHQMTITRGFSWAGDPANAQQEGRVWIDFNQNGIFEANELAGSFSRNLSTFVVETPTWATLGYTRMRIALKTNGVPTPCEIFDRGEVEDYTVRIIDRTVSNLNRFDIGGFERSDCVKTYPTPFGYSGTLQQYGSHIRDGFQVSFRSSILFSSFLASFYARNGVETPQIGSKYRDCPANWVYFTATGAKTLFLKRSVEAGEEPKLYMRIRCFGDAMRPDSLHLELDSTTNHFSSVYFWATTRKTQNAYPCFAKDQTPPTIMGCPTIPIVEVPISNPPPLLTGAMMMQFLKIQITDNCMPLSAEFQYVIPNNIAGIWGNIQPIKIIQFDSAGNKSVCETRLRFVPNNRPPTYCDSKGTAPWEQWIQNVGFTFPTVWNNNSAKEGYGNFTQLTPVNLARGNVTEIAITPQSSWIGNPLNANLFWSVWVDWNQDNDFDDAGEQVIQRPIHFASNLFLDNTHLITVPATALLGKTRMRVAMKMGGYPSVCETFEKGEVEDYTVNITNTGGFAKANVSTKGLNSIDYDFNIFPNPATKEAFLDLKDFEKERVEISISDVAGKVILNQVIENATAEPHHLNTTFLKNGTYFVRIQFIGNRVVTHKLYIF